MNIEESKHIGQPLSEVPKQDPTDAACMARKKQKQNGEVARDADGEALFGGYCRAWPGKATDHVGDGRCSLHAGAATFTGSDNSAFDTGLFSDHLPEKDRRTAEALKEYTDEEKLEELINWRLARLRRHLREASKEKETSFWDAFRAVVDAAGDVEDDEIRELARMLDKNNEAVQQEIDLVRKLIKARNKIAEGESVNISLDDLYS